MIAWVKQNLIKDLEFVRDGENEYVDKRGKISNHELTEPINMIGLITKKELSELITIIPTGTKMFIYKRTNYRSLSDL